jgi:methionine aminopeptidase
MLTEKLSEQDITKYQICSKLCTKIFKELQQRILSGECDVKSLCEYGDERIIEECQNIYKKEENKGIAFPTSISLNNCVGNYIYDSNQEYNKIKNGDVIKIELGIQISGCIAILGETICERDANEREANEREANERDASASEILTFLNKLKKDIVSAIRVGETNYEIKYLIQSKCTEMGYFPVENTTSYQSSDSHIKTQDSKYIILNYQKYYDDDGNVANEDLCFEFEEGEIYNINLAIVKNNDENDDETSHEIVSDDTSHIMRLNDYFYNLKLKNSREFYSTVKQNHGFNAFKSSDYNTNVRHRIGIKECIDNCILDTFDIRYIKDKSPVYHKKFTIVVGKNKTYIL